MKPAVVLFLTAACALTAQKIRVTESAGVPRVNEPISVRVQGKDETRFVTIGANQSRVFNVKSLKPPAAAESLKLIPGAGAVGVDVENSVFRADMSQWKMEQGIDDSGTLRGVLFKEKNVRYERNPNRMHWAPSFQRAGAQNYKSIGNWTPVQKHSRAVGPGEIVLTREGWHPDYPEVGLNAEYRFFAQVPYFVFRSTMTILKPIDMFFLRNQEMTMDDLFTHLAWPGRDGKPIVTDFEARKPILKESPMPVDVPWVAFFNQPKGYGYGAVILRHSATKTANPITSINDGANNGRYWDRRIINQVSTPLAPGDRFEEETAYVVFHALDEFLLWEKRLRNPVRVELLR